MKTRRVICVAFALALGIGLRLEADDAAKVTEAVNDVEHGSKESATTPVTTGTRVHDGEYIETGVKSRAELLLPTTSITRLGANTVFNYSVDSNTVDLQAGTILFCKPKDARRLNIKTEAVTAGIVGTTGFVSVHTDKAHQTTYIFGLVEGHATATAGGKNFPVGPGDVLEFRPGMKGVVFAFDVPRFVKSSPLFTRFHGHLPTQSEIDRELARYEDDVDRGFIQPPSQGIDYSGDIPLISTTAYDSALNAQGQPKGNAPPPPPAPRPPNSGG
ncbi:MAG TPA: FecR domain-containing protein [Candidatus Methylacidiphilales bacterium]|nr:FecR domain-containing protein [Candidatus Methylacidiphilales bacterium]